MKIDVLCSDVEHPIVPWLKQWCHNNCANQSAQIYHSSSELYGGDILYLVSCSEYISKVMRNAYQHVLVIHASDLPKGRGWSPHVWQILEGEETITLTLLDADESIDSGAVWTKNKILIPRHFTFSEINEALFGAEIRLMDEGLRMISEGATPERQKEAGVSYYRKRTPSDSEIDPNQSISQVFDQLRVADPERYPAFFRLHGYRYKLTLEKLGADNGD